MRGPSRPRAPRCLSRRSADGLTPCAPLISRAAERPGNQEEHGTHPECGEWIARTLVTYGLELQEMIPRAGPVDREPMKGLVTDMVRFHRKLKGITR